FCPRRAARSQSRLRAAGIPCGLAACARCAARPALLRSLPPASAMWSTPPSRAVPSRSSRRRSFVDLVERVDVWFLDDLLSSRGPEYLDGIDLGTVAETEMRHQGRLRQVSTRTVN